MSNKSEEGSVISLSPNQIHIGERRRVEMGDVMDLAVDLKENGLINPITVRPLTQEEIESGVKEPFALIAGGRRLCAAILLNWTIVPCYVREGMSELKHRILELHENLKRKQMSWDEEALANEEIMRLREETATLEGKKITQAEVAVELGVSPASFSRSLKAAEALKQRPDLKKSGSRKAAIRANDMAEYNKRLVSLSEVINNQQNRMVQEFNAAIKAGDSRDWIRRVPERTVDLILTDPPFGIDYFKTGHKVRPGEHVTGLGHFDDSEEEARDFLTDMVPQWLRVLRETGWLVCFMNRAGYAFLEDLVSSCCAEHFDYRWQETIEHEILSPGELKRNRRRCAIAVEEDSPNGCRFLKPEPLPWVWLRPNSRNKSRYPDLHAQNIYETILVCNMGHARLSYACQNVMTFDADYGEDRIHPHQKSIELAKELVIRTTDIGCTVMDSSYGSGALLAGAAAKSRLPMGCEKNETLREQAIGLISKYANIAPTDAKKLSMERYYRLMNRSLEGVDDFTEEEAPVAEEPEEAKEASA